MNLPRFTVTHPVFTAMLMLIMVLLGGFTLMRTSIDLMPELSLPTLTVITTYENASPEEIEELITKPLEEVLATIPASKPCPRPPRGTKRHSRQLRLGHLSGRRGQQHS